jgi:hypothetical protein
MANAGMYVAPALARGAAQLGGGLTEFVTGLLPTTFNYYVANPILKAAGSSYQFPAVSGVGAEPFERTGYRNPLSKIGSKKWDDLKGAGEVADWLGEHVTAQAPRIAAMFTAALGPRLLANTYLLGMGASAAGGQFRDNMQQHAQRADLAMVESWVEGGIEVLSEMLPLAVFGKVRAAMAGMTFAGSRWFCGAAVARGRCRRGGHRCASKPPAASRKSSPRLVRICPNASFWASRSRGMRASRRRASLAP